MQRSMHYARWMNFDIALIAEGYGENARDLFRVKEIEACLDRLGLAPEDTYELISVQINDERGSSRKSSRKESLEDFLGDIYRQVRTLKHINNVADLMPAMAEAIEGDYVYLVFFGTPAEAEGYRLEERRKELEPIASELARRYRVKIDSHAFVDAIHAELGIVREEQDQWNHPEVRMEQWAACRMGGYGQDLYFDDLNFENGRYGARRDELHDILEWLGEACPLMMATYNAR